MSGRLWVVALILAFACACAPMRAQCPPPVVVTGDSIDCEPCDGDGRIRVSRAAAEACAVCMEGDLPLAVAAQTQAELDLQACEGGRFWGWPVWIAAGIGLTAGTVMGYGAGATVGD